MCKPTVYKQLLGLLFYERQYVRVEKNMIVLKGLPTQYICIKVAQNCKRCGFKLAQL